MRSAKLLSLALLVAVTGCKKEEPPPPPPLPVEATPVPPAPPPEPVPVAAEASPAVPVPEAASPTVVPRDVLGSGASFQFVLRESSEVLAKVTAGCTAEGKGDAAAAEACVARIEAQGANEGIRFEKAGDVWTWVSFGKKADGTEEVFLKGPVALTDTPDGKLTMKATAKPEGMQAAKMPPEMLDKMMQMEMPLEVVDAATVAMTAPDKGRMVYRKK